MIIFTAEFILYFTISSCPAICCHCVCWWIIKNTYGTLVAEWFKKCVVVLGKQTRVGIAGFLFSLISWVALLFLCFQLETWLYPLLLDVEKYYYSEPNSVKISQVLMHTDYFLGASFFLKFLWIEFHFSILSWKRFLSYYYRIWKSNFAQPFRSER